MVDIRRQFVFLMKNAIRKLDLKSMLIYTFRVTIIGKFTPLKGDANSINATARKIYAKCVHLQITISDCLFQSEDKSAAA